MEDLTECEQCEECYPSYDLKLVNTKYICRECKEKNDWISFHKDYYAKQ